MASNEGPTRTNLTIRSTPHQHDMTAGTSSTLAASPSQSMADSGQKVDGISIVTANATTNSPASTFLRLPPELHAEIASELPIPDVLPLLRVSRRSNSLYIRRFNEYITELAEFLRPHYRWDVVEHCPSLVNYARVNTMKTFIEACYRPELDKFGGHYELEIVSDILEYYALRPVNADTGRWEDWQVEVWRYLLEAKMKYERKGGEGWRSNLLGRPPHLFSSLVSRNNAAAMEVWREMGWGKRHTYIGGSGQVASDNLDMGNKMYIRTCIRYSLDKSLSFLLDYRRQKLHQIGEAGPDKELLQWMSGAEDFDNNREEMIWACLRMPSLQVYSPAFGDYHPRRRGGKAVFPCAELDAHDRRKRLIASNIRYFTAKAEVLRILVSIGTPINTPGAQKALNEFYWHRHDWLPGTTKDSNEVLHRYHHLYFVPRAFLAHGGDPTFIHNAQVLHRNENDKPNYNILHTAVDPPQTTAFTPYEFFDQALATSNPIIINDPEPLTHLTPLHKAVLLYLTRHVPSLYHPCKRASTQCVRSRFANVPDKNFHLHAITQLVLAGASVDPKSVHLAACYRSKPALLALLRNDEEAVKQWLDKPFHPHHLWSHLVDTKTKRIILIVFGGHYDRPPAQALFDTLMTYYHGIYQEECLRFLVEYSRYGTFTPAMLFDSPGEGEYSPLAIAAAWGDRRLVSAIVTGRNKKRNRRKGNGTWEKRQEVRWWIEDDGYYKERVGVEREVVWAKYKKMWDEGWVDGKYV